MAKYLRPKRGSKDIAHTQNFVLRPGELFMEFPEGMIGKEPGRLVIGDGATSYDHIDYATTATNKFQPFITDPSIYIPRFENSVPASTSSAIHDYNASTLAISKIGNGSSTSEVNLPEAIGAIKKTLVLHNDSLAYLTKNNATISHDYSTYGGSGHIDTVITNSISLKSSKNGNYQSAPHYVYSSTYSGDKLHLLTDYSQSSSSTNLNNSTYTNTNSSTGINIYANNTKTYGSNSATSSYYSQLYSQGLTFDYNATTGTNNSSYHMEINNRDIFKEVLGNGTTVGWGGTSIESLELLLTKILTKIGGVDE